MKSTVQIRGKGSLTIPSSLRRKYGLNSGDVVTVIDLGDGCLLLSPRVSRVAQMGDLATGAMRDAAVSLDDMLKTLDEEREIFYRERYAKN